jgi:DNA-binding CsgD family transcriptional regulator
MTPHRGENSTANGRRSFSELVNNMTEFPWLAVHGRLLRMKLRDDLRSAALLIAYQRWEYRRAACRDDTPTAQAIWAVEETRRRCRRDRLVTGESEPAVARRESIDLRLDLAALRERITVRQRAVMDAFAVGETCRQIAEALGVSAWVVRQERETIRRCCAALA